MFSLFGLCGRLTAAGYSDVRVTHLPNGLTVVTKEVRVAPVVSVNVFYHVGSRNESTGITGVSHLLEHMMFKGTAKFPRGVFDRLIRQTGGVSNAATWTDYTYYWELVQSDYLNLCLKLEADRMEGALFAPADHKSEMVVVRSELEGRENSPDSRFWDLVNATAFTASPYQWPVIGWRSDVEGMTRDQIYRYYREHYGPNNATVILVGDFDTAKAVEMVRHWFGGLKPIPASREPYTVEPPQRGERRVELRLAGSAERSLLAWHIPSAKNPDCYALDVLEQVLSGGRSGRLYQALVEQGLATETWAYSASKTDPSLFYVGAVTQEGKTGAELESALRAEIAKVCAQPPSEEELARAKRQIEASFVYSGDDVRTQAETIGQFALTVGVDRLTHYIPSIQKVTVADVQRVAAKYLVDGNCTAGRFIPEGPAQPEGPGIASPGPQRLVPERWNDESWPHYRPQMARVVAASVPIARKAAVKPAPVVASRNQSLKPQRYELPGGLVLLVLQNSANPSVSVSGTIPAGAWLDPAEKHGLSEFVADMLDRGCAGKDSLQFAKAVEDLGASLSFSADTESVRVSGHCLSRDFTSLMGLMAGALRTPSFPAAEVEKLRREKLSGLLQEAESPEAVATRAFMNRAYPAGHPYHSGSIQDSRSALEGFTPQDLLDFHRRYYGPKGTVICVVGDVSPDVCRQVVQRVFADWAVQSGYADVTIPDVAPSAPSEEFIPVQDKSETTLIYGWPTPLRRSSPDYYAAVVMNEILGGGSVLSSRLGKKIRGEMGLVYDVGSWFQTGHAAGPWMASLGTNPKNAAKAKAQLKAVVEKMRREGPSAEEVAESRRFITGVLSLRLSTNAGIASFLLNAENYGLGLDYLSRFRQLYGSVTQKQVQAAAGKYLHPESAVLIGAGGQDSAGNGRDAGKGKN